MDINTTIERKNVNFNISRNLLIREIEDWFISSKEFQIFSNLSKEEYDKEFKMIIKLANTNNWKLDELFSMSLAQIIFLNNKDSYEKMLIDFYIENKSITDDICNIENIEEAKPKIRKITSSINAWLDDYLKKRAVEYRDVSKFHKQA